MGITITKEAPGVEGGIRKREEPQTDAGNADGEFVCVSRVHLRFTFFPLFPELLTSRFFLLTSSSCPLFPCLSVCYKCSMSWECPYQQQKGAELHCDRVNKRCKPMQKGCILEQWKRKAAAQKSPNPAPKGRPPAVR
jgi:hypothetical protein